jgi:tetratricopeptide (TPR) repeat protein
MLRSTLMLVLLAALAAPSAGQEKIKLKSGNVVSGRATKYDSVKQVLSFRTEDGKDVTYTMDQLDPRSVYLVYASAMPRDNGKGQLQLASLARDAGLYEHAARRYGYALEADPSLKAEVDRERAELRRRAADACLANARAAEAKGNAKETQEWLSILLEKLPDEPQAAEAAAMVEEGYAREANARDDALEREYVDLLEKDLKKAKQRYDQMIERTREGLTARNASKSETLWKGAIEDGEVVLEELERVANKYGDDPRIQEGAQRYRELTIDQLIEARLHLASRYTTSTNFNAALKQANAALALDPKNGQALAARARIEQAANQGLINW